MVRVAIELASQRGQEGGRHMWVWEMELMQAQFMIFLTFSRAKISFCRTLDQMLGSRPFPATCTSVPWLPARAQRTAERFTVGPSSVKLEITKKRNQL